MGVRAPESLRFGPKIIHGPTSHEVMATEVQSTPYSTTTLESARKAKVSMENFYENLLMQDRDRTNRWRKEGGGRRGEGGYIVRREKGVRRRERKVGL